MSLCSIMGPRLSSRLFTSTHYATRSPRGKHSLNAVSIDDVSSGGKIFRTWFNTRVSPWRRSNKWKKKQQQNCYMRENPKNPNTRDKCCRWKRDEEKQKKNHRLEWKWNWIRTRMKIWNKWSLTTSTTERSFESESGEKHEQFPLKNFLQLFSFFLCNKTFVCLVKTWKKTFNDTLQSLPPIAADFADGVTV